VARRPGGLEHADEARELLLKARTPDELRTAQAVLLPLWLGLSIEQTALAIGRSVGATSAMRIRFCRVAAGEVSAPRSKHELRNRAHASLQEEKALLARVCGHARQAPPTLIARLRQAMQLQFGKPVALSSVYRLLQRHGWRRVAADPAAAQALPPAIKDRRAKAAPRWVRA
jgi:transposase